MIMEYGKDIRKQQRRTKPPQHSSSSISDDIIIQSSKVVQRSSCLTDANYDGSSFVGVELSLNKNKTSSNNSNNRLSNNNNNAAHGGVETCLKINTIPLDELLYDIYNKTPKQDDDKDKEENQQPPSFVECTGYGVLIRPTAASTTATAAAVVTPPRSDINDDIGIRPPIVSEDDNNYKSGDDGIEILTYSGYKHQQRQRSKSVPKSTHTHDVVVPKSKKGGRSIRNSTQPNTSYGVLLSDSPCSSKSSNQDLDVPFMSSYDVVRRRSRSKSTDRFKGLTTNTAVGGKLRTLSSVGGKGKGGSRYQRALSAGRQRQMNNRTVVGNDDDIVDGGRTLQQQQDGTNNSNSMLGTKINNSIEQQTQDTSKITTPLKTEEKGRSESSMYQRASLSAEKSRRAYALSTGMLLQPSSLEHGTTTRTTIMPSSTTINPRSKQQIIKDSLKKLRLGKQKKNERVFVTSSNGNSTLLSSTVEEEYVIDDNDKYKTPTKEKKMPSIGKNNTNTVEKISRRTASSPGFLVEQQRQQQKEEEKKQQVKLKAMYDNTKWLRGIDEEDFDQAWLDAGSKGLTSTLNTTTPPRSNISKSSQQQKEEIGTLQQQRGRSSSYIDLVGGRTSPLTTVTSTPSLQQQNHKPRRRVINADKVPLTNSASSASSSSLQQQKQKPPSTTLKDGNRIKLKAPKSGSTDRLELVLEESSSTKNAMNIGDNQPKNSTTKEEDSSSVSCVFESSWPTTNILATSWDITTDDNVFYQPNNTTEEDESALPRAFDDMSECHKNNNAEQATLTRPSVHNDSGIEVTNTVNNERHDEQQSKPVTASSSLRSSSNEEKLFTSTQSIIKDLGVCSTSSGFSTAGSSQPQFIVRDDSKQTDENTNGGATNSSQQPPIDNVGIPSSWFNLDSSNDESISNQSNNAKKDVVLSSCLDNNAASGTTTGASVEKNSGIEVTNCGREVQHEQQSTSSVSASSRRGSSLQEDIDGEEPQKTRRKYLLARYAARSRSRSAERQRSKSVGKLQTLTSARNDNNNMDTATKTSREDDTNKDMSTTKEKTTIGDTTPSTARASSPSTPLYVAPKGQSQKKVLRPTPPICRAARKKQQQQRSRPHRGVLANTQAEEVHDGSVLSPELLQYLASKAADQTMDRMDALESSLNNTYDFEYHTEKDESSSTLYGTNGMKDIMSTSYENGDGGLRGADQASQRYSGKDIVHVEHSSRSDPPEESYTIDKTDIDEEASSEQPSRNDPPGESMYELLKQGIATNHPRVGRSANYLPQQHEQRRGTDPEVYELMQQQKEHRTGVQIRQHQQCGANESHVVPNQPHPLEDSRDDTADNTIHTVDLVAEVKRMWKHVQQYEKKKLQEKEKKGCLNEEKGEERAHAHVISNIAMPQLEATENISSEGKQLAQMKARRYSAVASQPRHALNKKKKHHPLGSSLDSMLHSAIYQIQFDKEHEESPCSHSDAMAKTESEITSLTQITQRMSNATTRPSKVREMARMFDVNQRDGEQSSSSGGYAIKVKSLRERRTLQDVTNISSTNEEEEFIC